MVFDFIYHEHLSYFSIIPLSKYFNQFGFKLIRIKKVSSKGGSLRYFFARIESSFKIDKSVKNLSKLELKKNISLLTFKKFNKKIESIKFKLNNFLNKNFHSNIIGYGASATTTTMISHFELNKFLKYLVDDNKDKINTYSPGYKIPVLAFNSIKEKKPDIIIIFAWRYYDAIINKLKKNKIKNIQIIVPLPKFRIIKL
jgi:C-methyltransferase.